jgi:aspartate/glutamate racemase
MTQTVFLARAHDIWSLEPESQLIGVYSSLEKAKASLAHLPKDTYSTWVSEVIVDHNVPIIHNINKVWDD